MGAVLTPAVSFAPPSSTLTRDRRFLTTDTHLRLPLLDLRRSLAIAASSPCWLPDYRRPLAIAAPPRPPLSLQPATPHSNPSNGVRLKAPLGYLTARRTKVGKYRSASSKRRRDGNTTSAAGQRRSLHRTTSRTTCLSNSPTSLVSTC
jgi:hypothetical protein